MKQFVKLTICLLMILVAAQLSKAQKPELVVQTGHSASIRSVAFSPDGKTLASGSGDHTVKLWEVSTGTELRTLEGPQKFRSVAFSPDGKTLAGGSDDKTVKLWDVATGTELRTLKGHSGPVISVAFSPDGKILASGSEDNVAFSPDGKILASGSEDNNLKLWDVLTGAELRTFKGSGEVAFSPDGKTLLGGGNDLKLWDVASGTELGALKGVSLFALSPNGKTLASLGDDNTIKLWDVSTGTELHTLKGHSDVVLSAAFSPDGKILASGSEDKTVKLWDVLTGADLSTLKGYADFVDSVAFSPDGILATVNNQTVDLWDVSTLTKVSALEGHSGPVSSVAFSPDGKTLARGSYDTTVKLLDVSTGGQVRDLEGHSEGVFSSVFSVAFSPDGKTLASGSDDKTVKLWDVATGTELRTLSGHSDAVLSVAFSPSGKILASGSLDYTVKLWDVSTGTELRTLKGRPDSGYSVAFSPDGKTVVGGSGDDLKLWDVTTGTELRTLKGRSPVAFGPDGKTLASGSDDYTIKLWDVATGTEIHTLKGHSDVVISAAFSPDGKILASGSEDNTIKLWDVSTGTDLRTLKGHSGLVDAVAFSSNNKYLVSGGTDTTIKVWEVSSGKELASLIALDENDLVVVTPDGLFDGSPAAWNNITWRFNNNTFNYAHVEAFFSDFYYPGLLTDIFAGKRPNPPSDISQKDRRQPQLKLDVVGEKEVEGTPADLRRIGRIWDKVLAGISREPTTVKVEVTNAPAGAQDVRLFRNGSLVRLWHGDVLNGQSSVTLQEPVFFLAGENRLTAYAFNHDNIKSEDATLTITGADSLKRKGTLHILAVGVSQYANREYNLDYTTDDATSFATQLKLEQEKLAKYQSVEVKTLLNENATKENILAELKKLAAAVQPEDAVVVYFSGHGKASGDRFYLVPHDLGYTGSRDQLTAEGLKAILAHSISDWELEQAFRDIDAGQMFMIIDACNSGQALENKDEPRRGPMNTRGLAQLAYEKGMSIMTASQNVEEAFVSERLKHSYLTFALVEEGLKTKAADADHNGEVTLREWFDYALARVPKLREEALQSKSLDEVNPTIKAAARNQKGQTPRVFYRREAEQQPLIIAKP